MANPPITIGPFTNVPAPGSGIRSDWAQQASTLITTSVDAGTKTAPIAGATPSSANRMQQRTGVQAPSTSGFGDVSVVFVTPFPNALYSVTVTPLQVAKDVFWFPVIHTVGLGGFSFFACAPQGFPFATNHPPSVPSAWTIAGGIRFTYQALGT